MGGGGEIYSGRDGRRVPLEIKANPSNLRYLKTKRSKLGHLLKVV